MLLREWRHLLMQLRGWRDMSMPLQLQDAIVVVSARAEVVVSGLRLA